MKDEHIQGDKFVSCPLTNVFISVLFSPGFNKNIGIGMGKKFEAFQNWRDVYSFPWNSCAEIS